MRLWGNLMMRILLNSKPNNGLKRNWKTPLITCIPIGKVGKNYPICSIHLFIRNWKLNWFNKTLISRRECSNYWRRRNIVDCKNSFFNLKPFLRWRKNYLKFTLSKKSLSLCIKCFSELLLLKQKLFYYYEWLCLISVRKNLNTSDIHLVQNLLKIICWK